MGIEVSNTDCFEIFGLGFSGSTASGCVELSGPPSKAFSDQFKVWVEGRSLIRFQLSGLVFFQVSVCKSLA